MFKNEWFTKRKGEIMMKKAVILFSGGLDSTTVLAIAQSQAYECYALSFDYGQRHKTELIAAEQIAKASHVAEHRIVRIDLSALGGSALTDPKIKVPIFEKSSNIPVTYVPARNTIFLAVALGWAEILGAYHIFIGANAVDYSQYPDCRPAFIEAFQNLAQVATKAGVEGQHFNIESPLLHLSKAEIIQTGIALGIDYQSTVSCYQANEQGEACGYCDSCGYRKTGFELAGVADPTRYY
jgi:7-cyano-7-deazaguanine synthase